MERPDVAQPITTILFGPNYLLWAHAMSSFLKGRKLWRYVTGDVQPPTKNKDDPNEKYVEQLDEWDSKNHQIITWLRNTSIPSIGSQLHRFETAKEVWDFLHSRYTTDDLAHQYQILSQLHRLRQESGQSIHNFLAQMQGYWDQLSTSEPDWTNSVDAKKFALYRDNQRLIIFLMALNYTFEPVRASLLHRIPLPTLDHVISELLSEETRLGSLKTIPDTAYASHHPRPASSGFSRGHPSDQPPCKYCKQPDHSLLLCPNRTCIHCFKRSPGHLHHQCPQKPPDSRNNGSHGHKPSQSKSNQSAAATPATSPLPASAEPSPHPTSVPVILLILFVNSTQSLVILLLLCLPLQVLPLGFLTQLVPII